MSRWPHRSDQRRRLPLRAWIAADCRHKGCTLPVGGLGAPESIEERAGRYLDAAVRGSRSAGVADKIAVRLARFRDYFHDAMDTGGSRRDPPGKCHPRATLGSGGLAWGRRINAHLASLSVFTTWVIAHEPSALPHGYPLCKGRRPAAVSARAPGAGPLGHVRTVKNLLDRLPRFHKNKGRLASTAAIR